MAPADQSDRRRVADAEEPFDERGERDLLVDYLFAHRKRHVQAFLARHELPRTGTKAELRDRLADALTKGEFRVVDLVTLLDTIEGWGNQHVYLYRATDALTALWQDRERVERILRPRRLVGLLNRRRPLLLPERPTLSSIAWSEERVRFVWVERRHWEERLPDEDYTEGGIHYKAHRPRVERGITAFEWDLLSGQAALLIQRLPSGTRYDLVRQRFERELEPLVRISAFEPVRASRGISRIEDSGEARRRQLAHDTPRGSRATFTSRSRTRDAFDHDPALGAARRALGQTAPVLGNFYWLPADGQLTREVHVKLYAQDQRVGIFGELEEAEVHYVLSRVRHHCR